MSIRVLTVDEIMEILPATVPRIAELTERLTPTQLQAAPAPDAWSVNVVLAHLRACHDVLGGSILRILSEDRPRWRRLSPRAWMRKTDYPAWEFQPALAAFAKQRAELLAVLESLPRESWDRTATVTETRGETQRSARYYGDWMAGHEREHLIQVREIVDTLRARR